MGYMVITRNHYGRGKDAEDAFANAWRYGWGGEGPATVLWSPDPGQISVDPWGGWSAPGGLEVSEQQVTKAAARKIHGILQELSAALEAAGIDQ